MSPPDGEDQITRRFLPRENRQKVQRSQNGARGGIEPPTPRFSTAAQAAKAAAVRSAYTVDVLIEEWTAHQLSSRSASYRERVPHELRGILKVWLSAPAETFERVDAMRILDEAKMKRGPVAANRLRAEARASWGWALKRGALTANPWETTPRPLARETARERVLSNVELGALYNVAAGLSEPWDVLLRLLILTGQRRGEVAGPRWEELDLDTGIWLLPGARTKNRHPHVVPLSAEAKTLLRTLKRRDGAEFAFEGPRETAVSGFEMYWHQRRYPFRPRRATGPWGGLSAACWVSSAGQAARALARGVPPE